MILCSCLAMPETLFGVLENSCMTTDIFEKWFWHFCRVIKERPLLLIFDGHLTHISFNMILKSMEENIKIVKVPHHARNLLQPLEISCFGQLKQEWEESLNRWFNTYGAKKALMKSDFAEMIGKSWEKALTQENIKDGFLKTGILMH